MSRAESLAIYQNNVISTLTRVGADNFLTAADRDMVYECWREASRSDHCAARVRSMRDIVHIVERRA